MTDKYYNNKKIKTILGKNATFCGTLKFNNLIKINGNYEGKIDTTGILIIGEGASIKADIVAQSIVVSGTVKGDIYATEKVELLPTGRVYGDIKTEKFKISDGAILDGKCLTIKK